MCIFRSMFRSSLTHILTKKIGTKIFHKLPPQQCGRARAAGLLMLLALLDCYSRCCAHARLGSRLSQLTLGLHALHALACSAWLGLHARLTRSGGTLSLRLDATLVLARLAAHDSGVACGSRLRLAAHGRGLSLRCYAAGCSRLGACASAWPRSWLDSRRQPRLQLASQLAPRGSGFA